MLFEHAPGSCLYLVAGVVVVLTVFFFGGVVVWVLAGTVLTAVDGFVVIADADFMATLLTGVAGWVATAVRPLTIR